MTSKNLEGWAILSLDGLKKNRETYPAAKLKVAQLTRQLSQMTACWEIEVIEEAGGIKELGSNQAAQARELACRMRGHREYMALCNDLEQAQYELDVARAALENSLDEFKLTKALILNQIPLDEDFV